MEKRHSTSWDWNLRKEDQMYNHGLRLKKSKSIGEVWPGSGRGWMLCQRPWPVCRAAWSPQNTTQFLCPADTLKQKKEPAVCEKMIAERPCELLAMGSRVTKEDTAGRVLWGRNPGQQLIGTVLLSVFILVSFKVLFFKCSKISNSIEKAVILIQCRGEKTVKSK